MQIAYPIEPSERSRRIVRVIFPDFHAAHTDCPKGEEYHAASACLVEALQACIGERIAIPRPSRPHGRQLVGPPALVAAKVALYEAMRVKKLTNVALAKQLGTVEGTVRRLLDLRHRSHVDQVEAALAILGRRVFVTVRRS